MSDQELEPLSAEAVAMLATEGRRPDVPGDVPDRVFEHLTTSIAMGAGLAGGGSGDGPAGVSSPTATDSGTMFSALSTRTVPFLVGAALVGGGIGAVVHARIAPRPTAPTITASAATPVSEPVAAAPSWSAPAPPLAPPAFSAAPTPPLVSLRRESPETAGKDVTLGMERDLIERARMAIARGEGGAALEALDRHAKDFPRGRLVEEREALAVQALVHSGPAGAARARAIQFRTRFPTSVFLPAVIAAVERAP